MKTLGTLALAFALSLTPVAAARADVWLLDIVTVPADSNGHRADSYLGALDLVARRHGGVRVSRFREDAAKGERPLRLVGLWRFPTTAALEALVADPSYADIRRLRHATIDPEEIGPGEPDPSGSVSTGEVAARIARELGIDMSVSLSGLSAGRTGCGAVMPAELLSISAICSSRALRT